MIRYLLLTAIASAISAPAFSDDIATPATPSEKCFPAEGLVKYYEKMSSLKPARLDTLEAVMSAEFVRDDETIELPKFWSRHAGQDTSFTVSADGKVTDFHPKVKALPKEAELCGQVRTPDGEEPKIGLSMDSDVVFKNRTGPYSLAELQDGVGDGKSFYKKMFGGPMAMLVPKMTHLTVQYLDKDTPLQLSFTQDGAPVAMPPFEKFGGTYVIGLDDIEDTGADTMIVSGGEFKLMPSPSVKKMKALGFSEDEDDGDD
jgi:hypothetical protein